MALVPASANATPARYTYEMCDSALPGGGTTGVRYAQTPGQQWSGVNNCEQPGGSLALRQIGDISPGGEAEWGLPIEPPPGGTIESISITGAACPGQNTIAYVIDPSWPSRPCVEENRIFRVAEDFRGIEIELACSVYCAAGPWIFAHYFAATMIDPIAPTLSEVGGSLLGADVKRGRQTIGAKAHDVGGGISNLSLLVNGQAAATKVSNCAVAQTENPSVIGTVAEQVSPCPADVSASWTVDTGASPFRAGANTIQICTSDFATLGDPNTTCSPPQTISVDNTCTESPVAGGDTLSAQFAESNSDTVTVGFGQSAAVTGQLNTDAGDAVPGATLCVKMGTIGIDARPNPVAVIKTDANGRFSYEVPPGPNREIVVGYRHDSSQVARQVRYYAHVQPSLSVTPRKLQNGKRVRLTGQVPSPSNADRVVVLQANVVGSKRWITFRKATTGAGGAFQSSYHFTETTRTTKYRFRAVVPTQAGYPWLEGNSEAAGVLVRPARKHKAARH